MNEVSNEEKIRVLQNLVEQHGSELKTLKVHHEMQETLLSQQGNDIMSLRQEISILRLKAGNKVHLR